MWSQFPFLAHLLEQPVDLRQVVRGHILDKRTGHFLIANAPVEPAQEQGELHQGCQGEHPPVRIDWFAHEFELVVSAVVATTELLRGTFIL